MIKHSLFDASTVQRMIQFMYTAAYTLDFVDTPKLCNESGPDDIQAKKAKRLAEVDRCGHPTPVLYNDKATTPPPTGLAMSAESRKAIAHVSVWAIADYYDVQKLKPLAIRNFGSCKVSSPREFAAVTTVVYTNTNARGDDLHRTVSGERSMRNRVYSAMKPSCQQWPNKPNYSLLQQSCFLNTSRKRALSSLSNREGMTGVDRSSLMLRTRLQGSKMKLQQCSALSRQRTKLCKRQWI